MPPDYTTDLGLQLYTVRDLLAADPAGTLRAVAEAGYRHVELMDTRQLAPLKPICDRFGLDVRSSFYAWTTVTGNQAMLASVMPEAVSDQSIEAIIDESAAAGLTELVFGYLLPDERTSLDDYRRICGQINRVAERVRAAGMQHGYHHHNFEFAPMGTDGERGWDVLLAELDGDLTKFEIDVFWAAIAGVDPVELIRAQRGRVRLLHLKDLAVGVPAQFDNMAVTPETFRAVGKGDLAFDAILAAAGEAGVAYCFVEQDFADDPLASIWQSASALRLASHR